MSDITVATSISYKLLQSYPVYCHNTMFKFNTSSALVMLFVFHKPGEHVGAVMQNKCFVVSLKTAAKWEMKTTQLNVRAVKANKKKLL